jgi:protein-L-isoaspartate(D-aspartate) O-methyltransferase
LKKPPERKVGFPASLASPKASTSIRQAHALLRPQALLRQVAADARRQPAPGSAVTQGTAARVRMVHRLRVEGVQCEPVLQAMNEVARHNFVDSALASQAYEDTSLPIGHGQTISKPSVVARMLEWLFLGGTARAAGHLGRVLEIGTGCGYQTALLARLAQHVVSVERLKPLYESAVRNLEGLRAQRVRLVYADGMHGHAPNAPYDSIISAAGGDDIPQVWLDQLAVGGRLIAPASMSAGSALQHLLVIDRDATGLHRFVGETVQFVPLKSGFT